MDVGAAGGELMAGGISIDVGADLKQLKAGLEYLRDTAVVGATVRALNRTGEMVKTEAKRFIKERRALPARVIDRSLKLDRATRGNLVATVTVSGRPISLKHYGAAGPRGRPKKQNITRDDHGRFTGGTGSPPVTVRVTGARKVVKGGFIGPNGHVYKREGKARKPIKVLFGPSIPTAIGAQAIKQALQNLAHSKFRERFTHEIGREIANARSRR